MHFKNYLVFLKNNALELISQFLATYNIPIRAICSLKFSQILQNANPLIRYVRKSNLENIFINFLKNLDQKKIMKILGNFVFFLLMALREIKKFLWFYNIHKK